MEMIVAKNSQFKAVPSDEYIVVDLPIRMTNEELDYLATAVRHARATSLSNTRAMEPISVRHATARDRAASLLALRKRREDALGADLFAEPAWDILLDLFVRYIDRTKTSTTSAALAARVPLSTALRHVSILVQKGLVRQTVSTTDLRLQYVSMSDAGVAHMLSLLSLPSTIEP